MTDFLTTLPWAWYAAALILTYGLLRLADWYMTRPLTETDEYCAQVDQEVDDGWQDIEFVSEIEAWLKARDVYETGRS